MVRDKDTGYQEQKNAYCEKRPRVSWLANPDRPGDSKTVS